MKYLTTFLITFLIIITVSAQQIAIRNVNLIDVKTGKVLFGQSVLISDKTISRVVSDKKLKVDAETNVIDAEGKYLMPGLVDGHVHLGLSGSLYSNPRWVDFEQRISYREEHEQSPHNSADYLHRYLRLAITSVMDIGGPFENFIIRDSISTATPSPNVWMAGPLFSTIEQPDPAIIKVASKEDIDKLFNKLLPKTPDFIKIWYQAPSELPAEETYPLIRRIGELCKKHGLKLVVHAHELNTARLAVESGANTLAHSIIDGIIPDDFIKTLKDKEVTYIPTLAVYKKIGESLSGQLAHHPHDLAWANPFNYATLTDIEAMDTLTIPKGIKMLRNKEIHPPFHGADSIGKINLKKVAQGGVRIATGTDAGMFGVFHASSYLQELEEMSDAGLSNAEILEAATINAAFGYGKDNLIGNIEKGKLADMILLAENPLESIENLNTIELIFKNGKIIKPDTIINESPEAVVQRQVNAVNARDIDAFLDTYAEDVEIYDSSGKLLMKGHEQMRERYGPGFKTPNIYLQIENRIVHGNTVIDKEKIRAGEKIIRAIVVYEVVDGKIKKSIHYY
ncbi:amidohydrolase family protein [Galbibacter sp. EGI 63066]|uniref:amidohydrolase family protein n=1 Tax=Galbibacter sp. EGI 63066 TaxID=2993559 RepID=UPI00224947B7|nr:amidohydrolase family protein [Galbibacter sp. EGI 63066]MCX2680197.1 amidohydrolase family protein [Galbibacter sp. EGI 63066]